MIIIKTRLNKIMHQATLRIRMKGDFRLLQEEQRPLRRLLHLLDEISYSRLSKPHIVFRVARPSPLQPY